MRTMMVGLAAVMAWASALCAEEVAPRDLPGRCTVAITAKTPDGKSYFGTGSVISPLGYVLTSTTVVPPKSNDIDVVSPGHFKLKGVLVKADEKTEFSLVRVEPAEAKALPCFAIRDSATAELGEVVMTVSNTFDMARRESELSVSVGLLSGRYKLTQALADQPVYVGEVLETTAATNPGSDGGPLLDGSGQLMGVLSLNVSNARWLGVAVPVEVLLADIQKAMGEDLAKRKVAVPAELVRVTKAPGSPIFPRWEARSGAFRAAAKKVAASVVAIKVERTKDDPRFERRGPVMGLAGTPRLLNEIMKRPNAPVTGVIVGSDGWIATSYFNVAGQLKSAKVLLADGKELDAKVVGWDQERDLALLKAEAKDLAAMELSADVAVGSSVCVLGRSPDPKNLTLTAGIVSAVGRTENSRLQFDAKANVGNTGGPLIGLDGKCLGIVGGVTLNSHQGQNSGIAFAVWSKVLPAAIEELKKGVKIQRRPHAALGIIIAPGAVDLPGAMVAGVQPGSAAEKAGIKRNDSILKIDGTEIEGEAQLVNLVREKKPGDKVTLVVRRLAREFEVEVTLGEVQ